MDTNIIPGLQFAVKHGLTPKEMEMYLLFLEQPRPAHEIATLLTKDISTVTTCIQKLKMKGLLVLDKKLERGDHLYKLVE